MKGNECEIILKLDDYLGCYSIFTDILIFTETPCTFSQRTTLFLICLLCLDFDECAHANDCHGNATCTNFHGAYYCMCDTGYSGNGKNCTDIDECTTGGHVCASNSTCTDTEGSYMCTCDSGYFGNGTFCEDVNECNTTNACHTNSTCINIIGSYTCACNEGHTGNGTLCLGLNFKYKIRCSYYIPKIVCH